MDAKKSGATGTSGNGKHGEKKDENFLTKTVHSIRDKVHEIADDVKEKTHKKHKKDKKTDRKSKSPTAGKHDSSSDSDDKEHPTKPAHPTSSEPKRDADKPHTSQSKPHSSATTEKKDTTTPTHSRNPSDKPASRDTTNKASTDHKDAAAPHSSSSSKPHDDNTAAKPSGSDVKSPTAKASANTNDGDTTKKSPSEDIHQDEVHISFAGASTVNDFLDRIDQAVERSRIIVEGGTANLNLDIEGKTYAPRPSPADLEKRSLDKTENNQNKTENKQDDQKKDEGEPLRLDYNEINRIEDLLAKLNVEPRNRTVVIENSPNNTDSIVVQKPTNLPPTAASKIPTGTDEKAPSSTKTSNESVDSPVLPKSILKTSQDPSSLDTSTKVASFQDDQVHVNFEGIQNIDEPLDRANNTVQAAEVPVYTKPSEEKRHAPQAPNQNNDRNQEVPHQTNEKKPEASNQNNEKNQVASKLSEPNQKREAPKAPSATTDQTDNDKPSEQQRKPSQGGDKVPTFKIPEHEFEGNPTTNQEPPASTNENKQDEGKEKTTKQDEKTDWI